MKRRIIVVMFLMCFITMATSLESLAETISRTHTASKYVTKVIEKVAYTVSGTVNYDKKSGLMTKDYVSWHGNISKADSHCETDYIMYYGGKRHTGFHLPYIRNQKAFFEDKKIDAKYKKATLRMDTFSGKYGLIAKE